MFILLIMISGMFSAELPRDVQREIDTYNASVAKADAVRQAAVDKAIDVAVKSLDALSRKAATAEDRRAIDDQILEIKKSRSKSDDLLGDGKKTETSSILGTWLVRHKSGASSTFQALADGIARCGNNRGTWKESSTSITFTWDNGNTEEFLLPLTGTVTVNSNGVKSGTTATKLEEKR